MTREWRTRSLTTTTPLLTLEIKSKNMISKILSNWASEENSFFRHTSNIESVALTNGSKQELTYINTLLTNSTESPATTAKHTEWTNKPGKKQQRQDNSMPRGHRMNKETNLKNVPTVGAPNSNFNAINISASIFKTFLTKKIAKISKTKSQREK